MKRQKQLLLLAGVLVVLVVIIAVVSGVQKHIDTISTVDKEIIATSESALTGISWTQDGETLAFTHADDTWSDADDGAFPVDQDKMSELLAHFESVHASFIIENVEDFAHSWETLITSGAAVLYPGHGRPFKMADLVRFQSALRKIRLYCL